MTAQGNRRVIVTSTEAQGSAITLDQAALKTYEVGPGFVVQEIWRQPSLPARVDEVDAVLADVPATVADLNDDPPQAGVLVRFLTIEPVADRSQWSVNLHGNDSRHVLTVISGVVDIFVNGGQTELRPGDTVVLTAGDMHDWRNFSDEPAVVIYTSVPLQR